MLKAAFLFAGITLIITGCEQKKSTGFQHEVTNATGNFFPVTQYLLGQIKELEALPLTPLQITTINGKTDSVWVKREEIRLFAQPFITAAIDSISLHSYFSEKSFLDQTINAFTFSYDPVKPLPASLSLRRWDVYVDPQTLRVKRIYILKEINTMPPQTVQLTWKPGYWCKITTITDNGNAGQRVKEQELIWNFNE